MQKHRVQHVLNAVKTKPLSIPQIIENAIEQDPTQQPTRTYTLRALNSLMEEGLVKMVEIAGTRCYVRAAKQKPQKQLIDSDQEWLQEISVAQPRVREWEPYVPPKDIPHRPGADDHLKWKSLGTP